MNHRHRKSQYFLCRGAYKWSIIYPRHKFSNVDDKLPQPVEHLWFRSWLNECFVSMNHWLWLRSWTWGLSWYVRMSSCRGQGHLDNLIVHKSLLLNCLWGKLFQLIVWIDRRRSIFGFSHLICRLWIYLFSNRQQWRRIFWGGPNHDKATQNMF